MTIATGARLGRCEIRPQIAADSMDVYLPRKSEGVRSVALMILPVGVGDVGTQ